jgi:hypothetical protein
MSAPSAVFRYLLLVLPAAFLLTAGVRLYSFFHERSDIWWTPSAARVPLAESHNRVAIMCAAPNLTTSWQRGSSGFSATPLAAW